MVRALAIVALWSVVVARGVAEDRAAVLRLALDLSQSGDHAGAAVEYRRLALVDEMCNRAAWEWAAAWHHWRAGEWKPADRMLDRAEEHALEVLPLRLLRGEVARSSGDALAAAFFWRAIGEDASSSHEARIVSLRMAAAELAREGRWSEAAQALQESSKNEQDRLEVLDRARRMPVKRPWLGGLLGVIPGLGYVYSGEYANGARSFLLNATFITLIVLAARDENWAGVGVAGFFEITWYTGSIYGGVDAAHRWNRQQRERVAAEIRGNADWFWDEPALPLIRLQFRY